MSFHFSFFVSVSLADSPELCFLLNKYKAKKNFICISCNLHFKYLGNRAFRKQSGIQKAIGHSEIISGIQNDIILKQYFGISRIPNVLQHIQVSVKSNCRFIFFSLCINIVNTNSAKCPLNVTHLLRILLSFIHSIQSVNNIFDFSFFKNPFIKRLVKMNKIFVFSLFIAGIIACVHAADVQVMVGSASNDLSFTPRTVNANPGDNVCITIYSIYLFHLFLSIFFKKR